MPKSPRIVKDFLVSSNDRSYLYKIDGALQLPVFLKPESKQPEETMPEKHKPIVRDCDRLISLLQASGIPLAKTDAPGYIGFKANIVATDALNSLLRDHVSRKPAGF